MKDQPAGRITLGRPGGARPVRDPVCGMLVDPAAARGGAYEHEDRTYHFCNPRCRERFAADPDSFLQGPPPTVETDPVCGMKVNTATAAGMHEHAGTTRYFCSPRCREKFAADPESFLQTGPSMAHMETPAAAAEGESVEWICPMDPEVLEAKPGPCPICGMALEPRVVTAAEEANPELEDMTRRFRVAAFLTVPLLVLAMGAMVPALQVHRLLPPASWAGSSCCWRRRWCCGRADRSSRGCGPASVPAASTCSPSSASAPASPGCTACSR